MNLLAIANYLKASDNNIHRTWSVSPDGDELIRSDGLKLWVREGGYGNEGKLSIKFSRPVNCDGRAPTLWEKSPLNGQIADPSIKVSATKFPDKIAADIVRRLLPESERVFALANESIDATVKFNKDRYEAIHAIAKTFGAQPDRHYQSNELTGKIDPYEATGLAAFKGNGYGDFKVSSKDSIDLELTSMNIDLALEVAEAIQKIFVARAHKA